MKYDFDSVIDRRPWHCVKYDGLDQYFGRHDLLPMWVADMDWAVCPAITEALEGRLKHPILGYPQIQDSYWQSIIHWLQRRHGLKVKREDVAFVGGVVRGVALAINRMTAPGDKIVIQEPVYYPFRRVIEGNGREVVNNPLRRTAQGYEMDLDGLRDVVRRQRPKMMILCNPHNPIGLQWDADALREVARITHEADMTVVSDEIHADLQPRLQHVPYLSVSPLARDNGVMIGAPSKTFNIPGLSSSWYVIMSPRIREPFYHWLEVNELGTPTEAAAIATEAAYRCGEEWLDQCINYISGNVEYVRDFLAKEVPEIEVLEPEASFLVWLDMRRLGLTHDQLIHRLQEVAHVAVNDGASFGEGGDGYVRLNVGSPRSVVAEALRRIAQSMKNEK